jgi:hypothetical protein
MGQNQPLELSEEEKKELSFGLLREWWLAATQALVDEAGSETALKYFKPYFINTGVAGACNIQKIMNIDAEEVIHRAITIYGYQLVLGYTKLRIYKADDGSFIWEMLGCATRGISKEGCMCLCEITPNAFIGELRHASDAFLAKSISYGDSSCQMLFTANGNKFKVSAEDEFELKALPIPPNDELNEFFALSMIGEFWSNATRGFIDFAGSEKASDRLRFHLRHSGLSFGIRMSERFDARERGFASIVEMIELVQNLHQRKAVHTISSENAEGEVSECPFSSSSSEMCMQYEAFFDGICEALDPSYEFAYDRMMTKGDNTCHWTITHKGEPSNDGLKQEAPSDDPIKLLTTMYIKGEITEEEFRKKLTVLKELKPCHRW